MIDPFGGEQNSLDFQTEDKSYNTDSNDKTMEIYCNYNNQILVEIKDAIQYF